jgi:hypothetical protein
MRKVADIPKCSAIFGVMLQIDTPAIARYHFGGCAFNAGTTSAILRSTTLMSGTSTVIAVGGGAAFAPVGGIVIGIKPQVIAASQYTFAV